MYDVFITIAQVFLILPNNHTEQGVRSAACKRMRNFTRDILDQNQSARILFLQKRSSKKGSLCLSILLSIGPIMTKNVIKITKIVVILT